MARYILPVEKFLRYCKNNEGLDPGTVQDYRRDLWRLRRRFPKRSLQSITVKEIDAWTEELLKDKSRSYANNILGRCRRFARWCRLRGFIRGELHMPWVDDMRRLRIKPRPRQVLPLSDLIAAIRRIERKAEHVALVLWGMLLTGARPQALIRARWKHVHMPMGPIPGLIELPALKHGQVATTTITRGSLLEAILMRARDLYREFHGRRAGTRGRYATKRDPVFPTRRGASRINPGGWTRGTFCNAVRRYANSQALPNFVAYVSRHSVITWLRLQGMDADKVQRYARHRSLRTQEAYVHNAGIEAIEAQQTIEQAIRGIA